MEVGGFRIATPRSMEAATGCGASLRPDEPAGLDVRAEDPPPGSPSSCLPVAQADAINAVLLSGGSAFGLDAAGETQVIPGGAIGRLLMWG